MIYAVIDTNVFISALITKNKDSATIKIYEAIADGKITPLYHMDILSEYNEVLHRKKFGFSDEKIQRLLNMIVKYGIEVYPEATGEMLVDMDDLIFYEVAMKKRDKGSYLITGNLKHFPVKNFIVTPAEMITILDNVGKLEA